MEVPSNLLSRRMLALRLDEHELLRIEPAAVRELHGVCQACDSCEQCALGLVDDFADVSWHAYCPNAATLDNIGVLPWFRRPAG